MAQSRPTAEQIARIENHLKSFSDPLEPPEQVMLNRCKGGEWTEFDQRFIEHELIEIEYMIDGLASDKAHLQTLAEQGIDYQRGYEAYLYHPDIILHPVLGEWFNEAARDLSARLLTGKDKP